MYEYFAQTVGVIDGDSCHLDVDLGFGIRQKMTIRLFGINTPELVGAESAAGKEAKSFLESLIGGKKILIRTHKDRREKYGRLLAEIYVPGDEQSVNDKMIVAGHAKPYMV